MIEHYWVTNLPGSSFGFNRMFAYIAAQISLILSAGLVIVFAPPSHLSDGSDRVPPHHQPRDDGEEIPDEYYFLSAPLAAQLIGQDNANTSSRRLWAGRSSKARFRSTT